MFRLMAIICCLAVPALGYSSGAPPAICKNNLTPEHHTDPQSSPAPYSFSGAAGVKSGDKLTLTLGGANFLGYAVQAHDANKKPIGQFKVIEANHSQTLDCHGKGDTLTHKKISQDSPLKKVEFQWIPPTNYKGKVQFIGTVAKDGGTFWVGKVLKTVEVQ